MFLGKFYETRHSQDEKKIHLGIFRSQIEPVMNHLHTRQSAKSTQNWVIFLPRDLLAKWRDLASSGWIKGHIHVSNWTFIYNNMFLLTVIQGGIQGRIQGGIQGTSNKTGSDMTLGIYRSQIGPLLKIICSYLDTYRSIKNNLIHRFKWSNINISTYLLTCRVSIKSIMSIKNILMYKCYFMDFEFILHFVGYVDGS